MKTLQFFLIFAVIEFCYLDETDDVCETTFNNIIGERCNAVSSSSCHYNFINQACIETRACSAQTAGNCGNYKPPSFHTKKCELVSSTCTETTKKCSDYDASLGDICSDLVPANGEGNRCDLNSAGTCIPYFDECSGIPEDKCATNIPKDYQYKCVWKDASCQKVLRNCDDNSLYSTYYNKELCHKFAANTEGKKCFYLSSGSGRAGVCQEKFENCGEYDADTTSCTNNKIPYVQLDEELTDYDLDFRKECYLKSDTNKCLPRNRKCHEIKSAESEDECINLEATDSTKKKCVYDSSDSSNKCKERYRTCQLYNDNEEIKTREECEKIIPDDDTKLCYFREEENKCEERDLFTNCEDYKGDDKNICESIISKTTNMRCVLEKDSTCKERTFHCTDTVDELQCLYYAKATVDNKRCAYDKTNSKCLEVYKTCEDFDENYETSASTASLACTSLSLYNGKYCVYENNRCISKNKKCSQAINEYECKLIEKTGVSDPDKKVCYYDSAESTTSKCKETYKYCSDYRGTSNTFCQSIKPYDESGNYYDFYSKCIYDSDVGCKRVLKECSDVQIRSECNIISPYIEENKTKYCGFTYLGSGSYSCKEYYKTCEGVLESDKCPNNIPADFSQTLCETRTTNGESNCIKSSSPTCTSFSKEYYINLCYNINPNCTYYSYGKCSSTTKECDDMKFFAIKDENENICNSIEVDDPNEICTLSKDKTKCEKIYKELSIGYTPQNNQNNQADNSSKFIEKRFNLFIIVLLLFI